MLQGVNALNWRQMFALDSVVVNTQILFSSHGYPNLQTIKMARSTGIHYNHCVSPSVYPSFHYLIDLLECLEKCNGRTKKHIYVVSVKFYVIPLLLQILI